MVRLRVELPGGGRIELDRVKANSSITSVKRRIEQTAGILPHTYHLTYLDASPLEDEKTIIELDIVCGALLKVVVWRLWGELVTAAIRGENRRCLEELRKIGERGEKSWHEHCAWCAVYMAAHGGHYVLVSELLANWATVAVSGQSPSGWTALHASASTGQWKTLCILLDHGADVFIKDKQGKSAAEIARNNGHKKCEQSLRFCEWNIKKHGIVQERRMEIKEREMGHQRAHQSHDSKNRVWMTGARGTEYPVPLHSHHTSATSNASSLQASGGKFDYSWFDKHRAQQLVPSTHQILTYSDPSSAALQPRSLLNPNGYIPSSTTKPHSSVQKMKL